MIKRIVAAVAASVVVALPLAPAASAAPSHHGPHPIQQVIDWE